VAKLPNDSFLDRDQNNRFDGGAWSTGTINGRLQPNLYHLDQTDTDRAWKIAKGDGIVIGTIDTGLDFTHPDIAGNVYTNPREIPGNGIDDDQNGLIDDIHGWDFANDDDDGRPGPDNDPSDRNGHGTAVAGVAAAVQGNAEGISGVAPGAKIIPTKVTGINSTDFQPVAAFQAANYLATNPDVDVVNVSGGLMAGPNDPLGGVVCSLVDQLTAAGKIVVASAGNGGFNTFPSRDVGGVASGGFAPAYCDKAIAVTSTTFSHNPRWASRSPFADWGAAVDTAVPSGGGTLLAGGNELITLRAAGTDPVRRYIGNSIDPVLEAENFSITNEVSQFNVPGTSGKYVRWRGTSFAAPQVAGAVALMLSTSPALAAKPAVEKLATVKSIIARSNTRFNTEPGKDGPATGKAYYGQLNIAKAVRFAKRIR